MKKKMRIQALRYRCLSTAEFWAKVPGLAGELFDEMQEDGSTTLKILRRYFADPGMLLGAAVNGWWDLNKVDRDVPRDVVVDLKTLPGLLNGIDASVEQLLEKPALVDGFLLVALLKGALEEIRATGTSKERAAQESIAIWNGGTSFCSA